MKLQPTHTKGRTPRVPKTLRREWAPTENSAAVNIKEATKCSFREASQQAHIPKSTLNDRYRVSKKRANRLRLPLSHPKVYEDPPRSGRPSWPPEEDAEKIFEYVISTKELRDMTAGQLIASMKLLGTKVNRDGRRQPLSEFAFNKIMYSRGYRRGKGAWKPQLTREHEEKRDYFCTLYEDFEWTRRAISIDEVKVKNTEHYAGSTWRAPGEQLDANVVNTKKQQDNKQVCQGFAGIGYNFKSKLLFIYTETEQEKKEAKEVLEEENKENEAFRTLAHAADLRVREREHTRGQKPSLDVYLRKSGVTRGKRDKGGIDAFRYREKILYSPDGVIPFCKELNKEGREVVLMEDNASAHRSDLVAAVYALYGIERFPWPPNSPDLNPIEKAWAWCRNYLRERNFVGRTDEEIENAWLEAWDALPYETINTWFEGMKGLCKKVRDNKGSNHFNS